MSVRLKIALTILLAGLLTAIGVVVTMVLAFQRFEYESAYQRGHAFLQRVSRQHPELLEVYRRQPDQVATFLRSLVLYEPDVHLYLLDTQGRVLASSGDTGIATDYRVPLAPVRDALDPKPMTYIMGTDPTNPTRPAIVAARALVEQAIRPAANADGFLYLVCQPMPFSRDRVATLLGTLAQPGLMMILLLVVGMAVLAVWVTVTITRPLARLTTAVAAVTRDGLGDSAPDAAPPALRIVPGTEARDEFGQLARGMDAMLQTLRTQWTTLRRLDHFRREGVSNLSHDLRSPLTATAACLETLQNRWDEPGAQAGNRELVTVALRNTHNAARLVRSLGDLAQLDEPAFTLRTSGLDMAELLNDVAMRFASRASAHGVALEAEEPDGPVVAVVDNELLERALANLVDNALKFCPAGGRITLTARADAGQVRLTVRDTGPGIALAAQPHLFDRFYQARASTAPATGEGGKGLGLAIVKRIAELHGGSVEIDSREGHGTAVTIILPENP
ncbi:MAG: ATP-binding protein [Ramlibacter sp.]|jgi:signal transduction histidine kinase